MSTGLPDPLGLTCAQFVEAYAHLRGDRVARYRALFREGQTEQDGLVVRVPAIVRLAHADCPEGRVTKFVLRVPRRPGQREDAPGALETESVLIPMVGRRGRLTWTLCVSSQVGCARGCVFCETAQMGLVRSLSAAEIVAQWFVATHRLGARPRNVVFMGMGEPMDNLDAVISAIAVLIDTNGAGVAVSRITVSTVGRVDGIRRLAEQVRRPGWHRLNLAVSLNAPDDALRGRLMPIARRHSLAELRAALEAWPRYGGAKFCIQYVLIPGVNDAPAHARALAEYVRGLPACVNVIPYNPRRDSPWPAPEEHAVVAFMRELIAAGVFVKRRRTKGREMMGACGQLGNPAMRRIRLPRFDVATAPTPGEAGSATWSAT